MDIVEIMEENPVEYPCRICFKESSCYSNIFDRQLVDGKLFVDILNDVLQLDVCFEDGFPQFVCAECSEKVFDFDLLKRTAHEVKDLLSFSSDKFGNESAKPVIDIVDGELDVPAEVEVDMVQGSASLSVFCEPLKEPTVSEIDLTKDEEPEDEEVALVSGLRSVSVFCEPLKVDMVQGSESISVFCEPLKEYPVSEIDLTKDEELVSEIVEISCTSDDSVSAKNQVISQSEQSIKEHALDNVDGMKVSNGKGTFQKRVLRRRKVPDGKKRRVEVTEESAGVGNRDSDDVRKSGRVCGMKYVSAVKRNLRRRTTSVEENVTGRCLGSDNKGNGQFSAKSKPVKKVSKDKIVGSSSRSKFPEKKTAGIIGSTSLGINLSGDNEVIDEAKKFFCDVSGNQFDSFLKLKVDKKIHAGKKRFQCTICGQSFMHNRHFVQHKPVHVTEGGHVCNICSASFRTKLRLYKHKQTQHKSVHVTEEGKSKPAKKVTKDRIVGSSSRSKLQNPEKKTAGIIGSTSLGINSSGDNEVIDEAKKFFCDVCGNQFDSFLKLKIHKKIHAGKKRFQCTVCGQSFMHNRHFVQHKPVHVTEGGHVCNICSASFRTKLRLYKHKQTQHKSVHVTEEGKSKPAKKVTKDRIVGSSSWRKLQNPEKKTAGILGSTSLGINSSGDNEVIDEAKKFFCDVCGNQFDSFLKLKVHKKIHSGKKRFQCTVCGQSFMHNRHFVQHKSVHVTEGGHVCNICSASFRTKLSLYKHKQTQHKSVRKTQGCHICKICGDSYKNRISLYRHMKTHEPAPKNYFCNVCKTGFQYKENFAKHECVPDKVPRHQCALCSKQFADKWHLHRHMSTHSINSKFKCLNCNARFKYEVDWKRHSQTICIGAIKS